MKVYAIKKGNSFLFKNTSGGTVYKTGGEKNLLTGGFVFETEEDGEKFLSSFPNLVKRDWKVVLVDLTESGVVRPAGDGFVVVKGDSIFDFSENTVVSKLKFNGSCFKTMESAQNAIKSSGHKFLHGWSICKLQEFVDGTADDVKTKEIKPAVSGECANSTVVAEEKQDAVSGISPLVDGNGCHYGISCDFDRDFAELEGIVNRMMSRMSHYREELANIDKINVDFYHTVEHEKFCEEEWSKAFYVYKSILARRRSLKNDIAKLEKMEVIQKAVSSVKDSLKNINSPKYAYRTPGISFVDAEGKKVSVGWGDSELIDKLYVAFKSAGMETNHATEGNIKLKFKPVPADECRVVVLHGDSSEETVGISKSKPFLEVIKDAFSGRKEG